MLNWRPALILLLSLLACSDKGNDTDTTDTTDTVDTTDTTDVTVGDQSLTLSLTDHGTLYADWTCEAGGTLTLTSASGDQRVLEASGEPCSRQLAISAPAESLVTIELSGEGGSEILEETMPALPDPIFDSGNGMVLDGQWVDDGVVVIGYEFLQGEDVPGWGDGVMVVLNKDGRHVAHVTSSSATNFSHKSAALHDGQLSFISYSKDFSSEGMAVNSVGALPIGGEPTVASFVETPEAHHFIDLDPEGVLYLDIGRVCDYGGSGETLAHDRLLLIPPGGEPELLYDTLDEWIGQLVDRYGLTETLDSAIGSYTNYDCGPDDNQRVRDVGHANGVDCEGDLCLISGIGSVNTILVVNRDTGALVHDLSTFATDWVGGLGTHHDVQWVSDDRILIFDNGSPSTGGAMTLYEVDWDAERISEVWTTRSEEDCIQALAMGWVSAVDGADTIAAMAALTPGDSPDLHALVSYGTGGIVTLEDGAGARLGKLTFDYNDGSTEACGVSTRGSIASGHVQHLSEASLAEQFPDWIRLD